MSAQQILVYSEKSALMAELLGKARQEADALGWQVAAVVASNASNFDELAQGGADVIYSAPAEALAQPAGLTQALDSAVRQAPTAVVLLGATKTGMETAARLAERLGAAYAPWTVKFEIDPASQALSARCMLYAGSGVASYQFKPGLVVLTSAPAMFARFNGSGRTATCVELPGSADASVTVLGSQPKHGGSARLEEASLVVDVGQGVAKKEDLAMVEALATLLDGQLACSRPVSSDRDWFPEWLGLSGKKIKPELCLTLGVSGAIQHIVGIRDSRLIAAVNSDEGAPIFAQADYGIVADLYEFLPAFMERLKARGVRPAWK